MCVSLFDGTLRAEVGNEKRVMAALAAESAMAQIRHSADTDFANLQTLHDGVNVTLPDFPDFQITTHVQEQPLAIPCTTLENSQYPSTATFPDPQSRQLKNSVVKAQVDVIWSERGDQSLSLTENVVNFTPSTDFSVTITRQDGTPVPDGTTVALASRDTRQFQVLARSEGQEVKDIQFTWYVEPLTGTGSIRRVSRDGTKCQYLNAYRNFNGKLKDSPGICRLVVEATFQGVLAKDKVRIRNEE